MTMQNLEFRDDSQGQICKGKHDKGHLKSIDAAFMHCKLMLAVCGAVSASSIITKIQIPESISIDAYLRSP